MPASTPIARPGLEMRRIERRVAAALPPAGAPAGTPPTSLAALSNESREHRWWSDDWRVGCESNERWSRRSPPIESRETRGWSALDCDALLMTPLLLFIDVVRTFTF
jgi:hypothetical protein